MHEIGLGITGLNLRTGTARNPYATDHFCGGSSSGTAAVVAAGLCPIAVGEVTCGHGEGGEGAQPASVICQLLVVLHLAGSCLNHWPFRWHAIAP
jgi:Asp-tRNA(Asn)/Glu-tRNA(Gln) amidotransferase A subunit family amidase